MKKTAVILTALVLVLVLVSCNDSVSDKGRLHILSIGDNFTGTSMKLDSCENDAKAVVEVFTKRAVESGMTLGITKTLLGVADTLDTEGATSVNIFGALNDLIAGASSNDITVIFLSTHGSNEVKWKVNYSESNNQGACFFTDDGNKGIYFNTLLQYANKIPGTVLILADLCYSGALIGQNNVTYNVNNYTGSNPVSILFSDAAVRESSKVFVLAACTYFQLSYAGEENKLSVFTGYMLKALGMSYYDADGVHYASSIPAKKGNNILLSDIYGCIYKESKNNDEPQVVQMSAGTNDLVLFSY